MIRYLLAFLALVVAHPAGATEAGWALLRDGGHVVLMRHAYAQGMAEPSTFDIEKCNTQRRLSDRGKQQARRIGSLIAARAAPTEKVLSSRLCRALETADSGRTRIRSALACCSCAAVIFFSSRMRCRTTKLRRRAASGCVHGEYDAGARMTPAMSAASPSVRSDAGFPNIFRDMVSTP